MDDFATPRHSAEPRTRGRPFAKGNPGRKPGSKNKTTVLGQALLKEAEERLVRKAIEVAEAGDGLMLKFLLDEILPKERCIDLPPMDGDCDPVERCEAILEAVCAGRSSVESPISRRRAGRPHPPSAKNWRVLAG